MFRTVLTRLLTALICAALIITAAPVSAEQSAMKKHTVMVYMCGSDLEEDYGQATRVVSKMIASRFNSDEINVILLLGGARHWAANYDISTLNVLQVKGRRPEIIDTMPLTGMNEAGTLSNFLNYCYSKFPAEHYELIMWDHGGGPIGGTCMDSLFYDVLTMDEMVEGLNASPFANKGLEWIAFDCCLMGSAEVAFSLASFARYMVATEDSEYGFAYDWLGGMENDPDALTTAKRMVDGTYDWNHETIARQNEIQIASVSVFDLSKASALVGSIDAYFTGITAESVEVEFTTMSRQRRDTTAFGISASGFDSDFDLVDLGNLVKRYESMGYGDATEVLNALGEFIAYNRNDDETCSGVTVYHPYFNKKQLEQRMEVYTNMDFSEGYLGYVQSFAAILTGTPLEVWAGMRTDSYAQRDNRVQFNLRLTEGQAANMGDSSMIVLHKLEDGYTATYLTNNTALTGDCVLNGEYSGTALFITDENGEPVSEALEYSFDRSGNYVVKATAYRAATEETTEATHSVLLTCVPSGDNAKVLEVTSVKVLDGMGGYTTAYGTVPSDYDSYVFTVESREETRDEQGALMSFENWTVTGSREYTVDGVDTWGLRLINDTIDTEELYAAFCISDSQVTGHVSELHRIKTGNTADEEFWFYDDLNTLLIENGACTLNGDALFITAGVTNLLDTEAVITLKNLTVNGTAVDVTAEVFGNGENWGLEKEETQPLSAMIPTDKLAGIGAVTEIKFDLVVTAAEDDAELGVVPVTVATMLEIG